MAIRIPEETRICWICLLISARSYSMKLILTVLGSLFIKLNSAGILASVLVREGLGRFSDLKGVLLVSQGVDLGTHVQAEEQAEELRETIGETQVHDNLGILEINLTGLQEKRMSKRNSVAR